MSRAGWARGECLTLAPMIRRWGPRGYIARTVLSAEVPQFESDRTGPNLTAPGLVGLAIALSLTRVFWYPNCRVSPIMWSGAVAVLGGVERVLSGCFDVVVCRVPRLRIATER